MAQSKNLEKTIAKIESRSREAVWVSIDNVKPYPNNPRDNEAAVDKVKASIERYGFNVPICVDKNGVIVTGHTRYKAALKIGMQKVLVIYLKDLTKDEIDSFRLVDNSLLAPDEKIKLIQMNQKKNMLTFFSLQIKN